MNTGEIIRHATENTVMNNFCTALLSRYRDFRFRDKLRIFIHYLRFISYRLQKNSMDRKKNRIPLKFYR